MLKVDRVTKIQILMTENRNLNMAFEIKLTVSFYRQHARRVQLTMLPVLQGLGDAYSYQI